MKQTMKKGLEYIANKIQNNKGKIVIAAGLIAALAGWNIYKYHRNQEMFNDIARYELLSCDGGCRSDYGDAREDQENLWLSIDEEVRDSVRDNFIIYGEHLRNKLTDCTDACKSDQSERIASVESMGLLDRMCEYNCAHEKTLAYEECWDRITHHMFGDRELCRGVAVRHYNKCRDDCR